MTVSPFVHLHVHSEYSFLDGCISIPKLVARAKRFGHSHVCLTDHGNLHGAIDLYSEAKKEGLIAIIGCEIYHEPSPAMQAYIKKLPENERPDYAFHLVLLAQDIQGYKNLLKVVSSAYLGDVVKEVPIVPFEQLSWHTASLVSLSACMKGELAFFAQRLRKLSGAGQLCLAPNAEERDALALIEAMQEHAQTLKKLYGDDNVFVELVDNNIPGQAQLVQDLIDCAAFLQLPVVATGDVHYLDRNFAETHALAIAIKNSFTLSDIGHRLRDTEFHFANDQEMRDKFAKCPQAIANTQLIAQKCSGLKIEMGKYYLPKITTDSNLSPSDLLRQLAYKGLDERFEWLDPLYGPTFDDQKKKEYWQRLDYELSVISEMGFPDYFLIVQDFINWAKSQGIPVGPGRGSGAGSLVAYALKITDLDPIPYNLIFERFLNPERISMPDFDVDFCQWRREEVIQYCVRKYGIKNVAQITTFGKLQAKAAVKSVGRAMNINYTQMDQLTKLFPPDLGITIEGALKQEPRLREAMEQDDNIKACMQQALRLEGMVSHTSVHAAGIVMSDGDMTNYVPVYSTDGKNFITQYEMKPTEKVGLVKFDFLGLKTLTVIDKAVALVKKRLDPELDIAKIRIDDKTVYDMVSQGHTIGIFQCESLGITQLIMKLKPSQFEDIIALVALFRPGPLGSGMVDDFVLRKHGKQKISYPHPDLAPILKDTYGMVLYQEQVQKIAAVLASYSLGEADLLRRAMGKKIPEEMAQQKDRFVSGAVANKIDKQIAEDIFELMAEFAKYGFNKSHSAAYGLVTYQTAYLKTHFPEEFMAASMTCDMDNTDKVIRYVEDCQRLGIKILPPDINRSELTFDVPGARQIGFALAAIKGIGEHAIAPMLAEREAKGAFRSITDLAHRVDLGRLGKKVLSLLLESGALDCFGGNRKKLIELVPDIVAYSASHHQAKSQGQVDLFAMADIEQTPIVSDLPWDKVLADLTLPIWTLTDLFNEKKSLGVFLSGHPMDFYRADVKSFATTGLRNMGKLLEGLEKDRFGRISRKVDLCVIFTGIQYRRSKKSGSLMAYVKLEEQGASTEAMMFEKQLKSFTLPDVDTAVLVQGVVEKQGEDSPVRVTIDRLLSLQEVRQTRIKGLNICMKESAAPKIRGLQRLIEDHAGPTPLSMVLEFEHLSLKVDLPDTRVELSDQFILQTRELLGNAAEILYM